MGISSPWKELSIDTQQFPPSFSWDSPFSMHMKDLNKLTDKKNVTNFLIFYLV